MAICTAIIAGTPRENFLSLILWRKRHIARRAPMLPPTMAIQMRVSSGIRHLAFLAFHLSAP